MHHAGLVVASAGDSRHCRARRSCSLDCKMKKRVTSDSVLLSQTHHGQRSDLAASARLPRTASKGWRVGIP